MDDRRRPIRFSMLVGVSSDQQVENKASIPDQIATCRKFIESWGGVEVDCHTMDGYSRTGYDGLSEAMEDIPPLKAAVGSAARNEYDVLLLDHFDRLGDLGKMLHNRFKRYRKQLVSARESGQVHDPENYDPWNDEVTEMLIHMQGIKQTYRINKLRRGWNVGVPKRIDDGLPPFEVPYGYSRVDKKTPPVKTERAAYVVMIKDWFLEGRPVLWIAKTLDRIGAPTAKGNGKWNPSSINHILLNPFYAGIVAFGQKRLEPGRRKKLYMQRTPQSQWKANRGKHEPLWDEATYLAIQNEYARRMTLRNYARVIYPLAGLMRCTVCRQKLIRRQGTRRGIPTPVIACNRGESHVVLPYDTAIELLAAELTRELAHLQAGAVRPAEEEQRIQCKIEDLQAQRERVQDGYKAGIYKKEEAADQVRELERLEGTERQRLEDLHRTQQSRLQFRALADRLSGLGQLGYWIAHDDPVVINQLLSSLCRTVWVDPDHQLTIDWRE